MTSTTASVRALGGRRGPARWGRTLVDGRHSWGALQIAPVDRMACAMRYRLTVYPPGITAAERRALVFRRHWPASGTLVGILAAALLGSVVNGWLALLAAAALFGAGYLVSGAVAGRARARVVRLSATVITTLGHREVLGDLRTIERQAGMLLALDALDETGALTPVEREHIIGRIHRELVEASSRPRRRRRS